MLFKHTDSIEEALTSWIWPPHFSFYIKNYINYLKPSQAIDTITHYIWKLWEILALWIFMSSTTMAISTIVERLSCPSVCLIISIITRVAFHMLH